MFPKQQEKKPITKSAIRYMIILVINTILLFSLYAYFVIVQGYLWVFCTYIGVAVAVFTFYIIYNRGFWQNGLKTEDLPLDWSIEKKEDFIAMRDLRRKRSKWALTIVFPVLLCLFFDMLYLYVFPLVASLWEK